MSISNILKKLNRRDTKFLPRFSKFSKVIIFTLLAVSTVFFVKNIFAADNIIKQTQDAQETGNNAESWQLNSWNTTAVNVLTTLIGKVDFNDDGSIKTSYVPGGLLGINTKMIASLYHPQASGVEYIAQVKDNFLGKPTYAQDTASKGLEPLLPMWKSIRNIIYSLFAVVFVAIGIMIMLRVKISPQAVISIQNALPKLITSLILVTFSYAIAGLVIDLSYWVQNFAIALFFSAKGTSIQSSLYNNASWQTLIPLDSIPTVAGSSNDMFYNFSGLANADFTKLSMLANRTVPFGSLILLGGVIGQVILGSLFGGLTGTFGSINNLVGNTVGGAGGWIIGAAAGIIFMIVLFVLVAIWLIKLFFGLLKTYVSVLLKILSGPLEIGMGAFPNSKVNFSSWIIDLIAHVAVFPVVLIALVLINYLVEISAGYDLWMPNLLDTGLINPGNQPIIPAAIGIAGLAMLSKLPDLVPAAIFKLKPSEFGKAIGENLEGISKGPVGKMATHGALEGATQKARDRYGDGSGQGKFGKFVASGIDTLETAGFIKEKKPR